jgi:hypothetical protein
MSDFPTSLGDFQQRYPNEASCAAWLFAARWPSAAGGRARMVHRLPQQLPGAYTRGDRGLLAAGGTLEGEGLSAMRPFLLMGAGRTAEAPARHAYSHSATRVPRPMARRGRTVKDKIPLATASTAAGPGSAFRGTSARRSAAGSDPTIATTIVGSALG